MVISTGQFGLPETFEERDKEVGVVGYVGFSGIRASTKTYDVESIMVLNIRTFLPSAQSLSQAVVCLIGARV